VGGIDTDGLLELTTYWRGDSLPEVVFELGEMYRDILN